jgi:hypothetical protein
MTAPEPTEPQPIEDLLVDPQPGDDAADEGEPVAARPD